jgi:hypothetical protein
VTYSFADPIASIDRKKIRIGGLATPQRWSVPERASLTLVIGNRCLCHLARLFWLFPAPGMERDPLARLGANPSRDQGRSRFPHIIRFVLESRTLFPGLIATSYKYLIAWYVGFFFLEPARERNWCRSVWVFKDTNFQYKLIYWRLG